MQSIGDREKVMQEKRMQLQILDYILSPTRDGCFELLRREGEITRFGMQIRGGLINLGVD